MSDQQFSAITPSTAEIGHNCGPKLFVDPGLGYDFVDTGPIALRTDRVPEKELEAFYAAVRSQGPETARQAAMSRTAERARANPDLGHHAYRAFEQIVSRCRWKFRYHCEPVEELAHFTSAADGSNMRRPLESLQHHKYIARINIPRLGGGRPVPYFTVICTEGDRSGQSHADLVRAAKDRNLPSDSTDLNGEANRHCDGMQAVMVTVSPALNGHSNRHGDGLQTVIVTAANRHCDGHNVEVNVDSGIKEDSSPLADEAGAWFDTFWRVFPKARKFGKGECRSLFRKIVTGKHPTLKATADQIIDAAKRGCGISSDPAYAPTPHKWLSEARWEDDPASPPKNKLSRWGGA